jgi:hypothetical protein
MPPFLQIHIPRPARALLLILALGLGWRVWLLQMEAFRFNSDEAVVGLMALHIAEGQPIPAFYYGQHYLNSNEALLTAGVFVVFGPSLEALRGAQVLLYVLVLLSAYWGALQICQDQRLALLATFLMAVPTMLGTMYTAMSFGGYSTSFIYANLIYGLGWRVTLRGERAGGTWGLLGGVMGLAWWTYGANAIPIGIIGLIGLRHFRRDLWRQYALAALGFALGSGPWWLYNLQHEWQALDALFGADLQATSRSTWTLPEKLFAYIFLGLSSLYGWRLPWETSYQTGPLAWLAYGVYGLMFIEWWLQTGRRLRGWVVPARPAQGWLVFLALAWVTLLFLPTSFADVGGRYFLPIWLPVCLGVVWGAWSFRRWHRLAPAVAIALLLAYQGGTALLVARGPVGVDYLVETRLRVPPEDDAALLAFLAERDYHYAYAAYWTGLRLAFLSQEALILDTSLPHDERGLATGHNRYPPYQQQVAAAERRAWISQNHPRLEACLEAQFSAAGLSYQVAQVGVYRVYYDLSQPLTPYAFGWHDPQRASQWLAAEGPGSCQELAAPEK